MRRLGHLVVVAGPTAAGKSSFIREILADRLPEIGARIGIERLQDWRWMRSGRVLRQPRLEANNLIVEYDFLWSYPGHNFEATERQKALSTIIDDAREFSLVTLWTPASRLKRQVIEGKLRTRLQPDWIQAVKADVFRLLPRFVMEGFSRLPIERIDHRLATKLQSLQYLLVLKVYSDPNRLAERYRRWFDFVDGLASKMRVHIIVEFDPKKNLKFYSRSEWEDLVRTCEKAARS